MNKVAIQVAAILAISILLGIANHVINPNRVTIALEKPAATTVNMDVLADTTGVVQEPVNIGRQQVKALLAKDRVVLIDARESEEYLQGHLPGAINIPLDRLGEFMDRVNALPREKWIVTYCDGPPCDKAALLASDLYYMDFPRVAYYDAGIADWMKSEEVVK